MKHSKYVTVALAMLLGACMATPGCSRTSAESDRLVTLNIWSMWNGQEERAFQSVLDRYQELHPHVRIKNLGSVRDDTKTVRAIVAGTPPDIFTLADPLFLGPLVANNALHRMDGWMRESGLREERFVPASLSQCRTRGGIYAMPFLIDVNALLWNKAAFRDAGLDPERPPRTIEEFEEFVKKLTKRDAKGEPTRLGLLPPDDIYLFKRVFGGSLYDEQRTAVTPDSPENVLALAWYCRLIESMGSWEKVNGFKAGFGNNQSANNPFYTGQVAMMISGQWNPIWLQRYAPHVEYGVAAMPAPAAHPERAMTTWLGGNMFCIPKGSPHPKEAWDFLAWTQTDEAQVLFASVMNGVPNQRSVLRDPSLRTGELYKEMYGKFVDISDSPNASAFPILPVANLYGAELLAARDMALNGDKTPAKALKDVRIRVQRELDRYSHRN